MWQGSYTFTVNQWGVGHGAFHSQSIHFQPYVRPRTTPVSQGTSVRVIYDCGSGRKANPKKVLAPAVRAMLNEVPVGSKIDLLVISHFDHDHVNGLAHLSKQLAGKRVTVEKVWAPILTRNEALLAIVASGLTGTELQQYVALVANPISELSVLFPGAVITPLEPDGEPISLLRTGEGDSTSGNITLTDIGGTTLGSGRGLAVSAGPFNASEVLWEFRPYVTKSTLDMAQAMSTSLEEVFQKSTEEWTADEIIDFASNEDHKALRNDFHDGVYKSPRESSEKGRLRPTGSNLSTVCLYSGPVAPYDWCHFRRGWAPVTRKAIPIAPAWLGTGDAALRDVRRVDALRRILTQSRLDRVGISSAPHHGSSFDSDAYLWDSLTNVRFVTIEADNKTGGEANNHPHIEVLKALEGQGLAPTICTDGDNFSWRDKRMR